MQAPKTEILDDVAGYYSKKLAEHGQTPQGVDWNGPASQVLRFEQLCRIIGHAEKYSLNDLGCGYGALCEYLEERFAGGMYNGFDISEDMILAAQQRFSAQPGVRFVCASEPDELADYGVASGIFNVRMNHSEEEWFSYIESVLDVLDRTSSKGFAFNCLTSYSDAERMRSDLYYADPCRLFDICKRRYSRNVTLCHDYGLYEFTILVRKG